MAALPALARAALIEHGTPTLAVTALIAAAADILTDVLGADLAWDALGAAIEAAQAEWVNDHAN